MWRLYKVFAILIFFTLSSRLLGQARIELIDSSKADCSFRGLSVVTDKVVWVSGSRGTVGRSVDGGTTWTWVKVPGFEKSDFRDIEAFDENRAVIMASGTPAVILKTVDGGKTWKLVFKDERPEMFLDAMDFWDKKHGMMVGDPINGRFVLLETKDGGDTWKLLDSVLCPAARDSEAVFAASGTSLRCWGKNEFGFVTGGSGSRILLLQSGIKIFQDVDLSIAQGTPSRGAFSFSVINRTGFHIAGGDYLCDTCEMGTGCLCYHNGEFMVDPQSYYGYSSCIETICISPDNPKKNHCSIHLVVTGTSYTSLETIKVIKGHYISIPIVFKIGFHVVRKAKKGKAVFLAGSKGRIGKLSY